MPSLSDFCLSFRKETMMRLDIGCGCNPTGNVNCDLFIGKNPHLNAGKMEIRPKTIPNFVRCDANCLPFRAKVFSESFCSHVLEHRGVNCVKVLREMVRVTENRMLVVVPHRFVKGKWGKRCKMHDKYFGTVNIRRLFRMLGLNPEIEIKYRCFPHDSLCWVRLPWEMKIELFLK